MISKKYFEYKVLVFVCVYALLYVLLKLKKKYWDYFKNILRLPQNIRTNST